MNDDFILKFYDPDINEVVKKPLEDMVRILLPSQVNIDFHIEALKAQAVIIRTNLVRCALRLGGSGCEKYKNVDFCKGEHCYDFLYLEELKKAWKDRYEENIGKIHRAVEETRGYVITLNEKPIMAKYHDTCGGSTENSENVIDNNVLYLRKVLCDYCINSPNWENAKDFSIEEIENLLDVRFHEENASHYGEMKGMIEDIERDEEGRVRSLKIAGKIFEGKKVMELLNLDSTRFVLSPLSVRIKVKGKGHGLGFCQYGGNEMANRGYSYLEILNYYYTGIQVIEYPLPCINNPLLGKIFVIDPGHGGQDIGYIGELGLMEKDIVLLASQKIKANLEKMGASVYLTRDEDRDMLLVKRAEYANKIMPDFFLSIHMSYFHSSTKKGAEVYCFRGDDESKKLGNIILGNLEKEVGIINKGAKEGNFFLLKNVGASSLIVELGYLSSTEEEQKFFGEEYVEKLANIISMGILEYFEY